MSHSASSTLVRAAPVVAGRALAKTFNIQPREPRTAASRRRNRPSWLVSAGEEKETAVAAAMVAKSAVTPHRRQLSTWGAVRALARPDTGVVHGVRHGCYNRPAPRRPIKSLRAPQLFNSLGWEMSGCSNGRRRRQRR